MSATEQRRLSAIMFTDMVGYSALAQRNEALALEMLEEHRKLLRELFPKFQGREVETTGDGFLVEFSSALEAVRCAIEIQRTLAVRNISSGADRTIDLRIGIHVGDVVHRDGHVLGDGVNIAARLQPLASPGGICVSVDVERQIRNSLEARFEHLGPQTLKNIATPMELFRIVLPWEKQVSGNSRPAVEAKGPGLGGLVPARWAWIVIAVAVALGFGWWMAVRRPERVLNSIVPIPNAPPTRTAVLPDQKSVAVLPFVNMSADKADEYLSDGMTEELLNALARIKGLRVPGRSSSFAFKGKNEEDIFRKVGEQLHVSTVLEGSVRKAGEKLRVTTQLINVADGFHLWSETYDRDMTNIFAIQSDIAARVSEALKIQLLGAVEGPRKPTENIEAYKLYLKGRQLWNWRTGPAISEAITVFNRAIELDPSYALAWAGIADCYAILDDYAGLPSSESFPKARAAAQRALELDSTLGQPHATLGEIKACSDWDWAGAELEFRHALELDPNYATAYHWYGSLLDALGRLKEALALFERGQQVDPFSEVINSNLGRLLFLTGEQERGIAFLKEQSALDPGFQGFHFQLGILYLRRGDLTTAIPELEVTERVNDLGYLGYAYGRAGRTADAVKILEKLETHRKQGRSISLAAALVQHGLGEDAKALDLLDRAVTERPSSLTDIYSEPVWSDMRSQPRFQAILRKMNLVK